MNHIPNFLSEKSPVPFSFHPAGSSYVCDPPVTTTDRDWVVYAERTDEFIKHIKDMGFTPDGAYEDVTSGGFQSYRKGRDNIVLVATPEIYNKYLLAIHFCKRFNLTNKQDRIDVHGVIVRDEVPADVLFSGTLLNA